MFSMYISCPMKRSMLRALYNIFQELKYSILAITSDTKGI